MPSAHLVFLVDFKKLVDVMAAVDVQLVETVKCLLDLIFHLAVLLVTLVEKVRHVLVDVTPTSEMEMV